MGDLTLNLWDCGGQEAFYESYFESERDSIFQDVEVLIYVIDIKSVESDLDLKNYGRCIDAIAVHSSTAKVFCLIHKMDTVPIASRTHVFRRKESEIISRSRALDARCYATSIWDETLYKVRSHRSGENLPAWYGTVHARLTCLLSSQAWSSIVHALIPNISNLERSLNEFADACGADEVVLFERATFLVVTHCTRKHHAGALLWSPLWVGVPRATSSDHETVCTQTRTVSKRCPTLSSNSSLPVSTRQASLTVSASPTATLRPLCTPSRPPCLPWWLYRDRDPVRELLSASQSTAAPLDVCVHVRVNWQRPTWCSATLRWCEANLSCCWQSPPRKQQPQWQRRRHPRPHQLVLARQLRRLQAPLWRRARRARPRWKSMLPWMAPAMATIIITTATGTTTSIIIIITIVDTITRISASLTVRRRTMGMTERSSACWVRQRKWGV